MSFHPSSLSMMNTGIRYEYAEESSNSSCSGDPTLFKREPAFHDSDHHSPFFDYHLDVPIGNYNNTSSLSYSTDNNNDYLWNHENVQAYSPVDVKLDVDDLLQPYVLGSNSGGVLSAIENNNSQSAGTSSSFLDSRPPFGCDSFSAQTFDEEDFDLSGFVQDCSSSLLENESYQLAGHHQHYDQFGYGDEEEAKNNNESGGYGEENEENSPPAQRYSAQQPHQPQPRPKERSAGGIGGGGGGSSKMTEGEQQMAGGFYKPAYSFSCLIGLSLKNSSSGELTVSEIYAFLCEHFPYFRVAPGGWKNSVRHNLSLNKCFQKIEVETPGCHGRKSCLWRLNPHRETKMDQELRKARERNEPLILKAMTNPGDLDSIQAGTKGMPSTVRRRIVVPVEEATYVMKSVQPKIIQRRMPYASSTSSSAHHRLSTSSTSSFTPVQQSSTGKLSTSSGESVREAAARKLDLLLQQKSAIAYNPELDEDYPAPTPKRSSGGSHSLKNEDFADLENFAPAESSSNKRTSRGSNGSNSSHASSSRAQHNHNTSGNAQSSSQLQHKLFTSPNHRLPSGQNVHPPTAFPVINQQEKQVIKSEVGAPAYTDYHHNPNHTNRSHFHDYHRPGPSSSGQRHLHHPNRVPGQGQPPPRPEGKPDGIRQQQQQQSSALSPVELSQADVNSLLLMGPAHIDRSMSPLNYSSCYDIVTDAIHNNTLLLESALSQSPCKRLI